MGMLYFTPGLSHNRRVKKTLGRKSHWWDNLWWKWGRVRGGGGGGGSRQGCCRANGRTEEVKDRRSFNHSLHQGSSTLCVVPSHQQHADMLAFGFVSGFFFPQNLNRQNKDEGAEQIMSILVNRTVPKCRQKQNPMLAQRPGFEPNLRPLAPCRPLSLSLPLSC